MVSPGHSTAPRKFPQITPPISPTHNEEPDHFGDRKDLQCNAKPALALPLVAKTPRSFRESSSASTRASPSASTSKTNSDEQDNSWNSSLASKGGGENARLLADGVTYKGETCSVHVCWPRISDSRYLEFILNFYPYIFRISLYIFKFPLNFEKLVLSCIDDADFWKSTLVGIRV